MLLQLPQLFYLLRQYLRRRILAAFFFQLQTPQPGLPQRIPGRSQFCLHQLAGLVSQSLPVIFQLLAAGLQRGLLPPQGFPLQLQLLQLL